MNSTGSPSRIALFSRPYASTGDEGATTTSPGTWMNQASRLCECCAAAPPAAPAWVRTTSGTASWPPDM